MMMTDKLVRDKALEFMSVLGHSRITGAVQAVNGSTAVR
jgi:hypothetical protein